ncbi:MAG: DUF4384 domain-containing protein [Rhodopseudomonas sp.]|nr:DUF4384 domain-containing protein [Rhodopseudomonas sp.]
MEKAAGVKLAFLGAALCLATATVALAQSADNGPTRDARPEQRSWYSEVSKYFSAKDSDIHVSVSADKHVYKIGDAMRLSVEVDKPAYVYVFDIGTSGHTTLLFPNKFHENARLKPGAKISIPGEKDDWSITVDGPVGADYVIALATSRKMSKQATERMRAQLKGGATFATIKRPAREVVRDLVVTHGKVERGQSTAILHIVRG